MSVKLPYYILAGIIIICAILHSILLRQPAPAEPDLDPAGYAQGYYIISPRLGTVRIVPFATHILQSPVSGESHGADSGDETHDAKKP